MAKKLVRREVFYPAGLRKLIQARARNKGLLHNGKPSEKAYIEFLIYKDLRVSDLRVQKKLEL